MLPRDLCALCPCPSCLPSAFRAGGGVLLVLRLVLRRHVLSAVRAAEPRVPSHPLSPALPRLRIGHRRRAPRIPLVQHVRRQIVRVRRHRVPRDSRAGELAMPSERLRLKLVPHAAVPEGEKRRRALAEPTDVVLASVRLAGLVEGSRSRATRSQKSLGRPVIITLRGTHVKRKRLSSTRAADGRDAGDAPVRFSARGPVVYFERLRRGGRIGIRRTAVVPLRGNVFLLLLAPPPPPPPPPPPLPPPSGSRPRRVPPRRP